MTGGETNPFPRLDREARAFLEERVAAFEAVWSRGECPRIEDYSDDAGVTDGQLLVELVHADLEFRIKAGEPTQIEEYLARFPSLDDRPDDVEALRAAASDLRREREARSAAAPTPVGSGRETTPLEGDMPAVDATSSLRDRTHVGRFAVERVLGRGGYGTVYLAVDPALGRRVAVKVPHPHVLGDLSLKARFLQEARAAASLEHSNVVPVLEVGEDGPLCFLISTYCPGENLAEWLAKQSAPVAPQTAAAVVAALADAVDYSHARGVLHRDLKPANVMLDTRPPGHIGKANADVLPFVPRLTDFGLAKVVEAGQAETRTSVILGTPVYMSPEQADGVSEVGPPADIYSLGVILYELITGRVPFEGSLANVLEQVRSDAPTSPVRLRSDLPADLETICLKCLHKETRHRYSTAGALADDLRRFLKGLPIEGRRLTLLQKFARWAHQPSRLRDAGVYAVALNAVFLLWMPWNATLIVSGRHSLTSSPQQVEGFRILAGIGGSVAVALSMHVPMLLAGWKTLQRKHWAVRLGIVLSLVTLGTAIASWTELIVPFGGMYADPRLRTTLYTLLVPLFAAQLAGYLIAEVAARRLRS